MEETYHVEQEFKICIDIKRSSTNIHVVSNIWRDGELFWNMNTRFLSEPILLLLLFLFYTDLKIDLVKAFNPYL